jgi:tetratricopeptide (TPR) repeat protein
MRLLPLCLFPIALGLAQPPESVADFEKRLAKASPTARSESERALALRLSANRATLHDAEAYARQAIVNLNVDDYIARERQRHQSKIFYSEEAREKFRAVEAASWSTLGRILIREGRDADARQALQKSLAAARTADAAAAFAALAVKQGDIHTVLDALGTAILTGKADRATLDRFEAAYRESGMRPDPEQWLDRRYRHEMRNPLEPPPFRAARASSGRTVLLELGTGADCEPCISVDLAVDALLHRYARQELIVIESLDAATAPTVVLDGEAIESGEGLASVAKPVFDTLDSVIQKRIAVPAAWRIQLSSTWSGRSLQVDAAVENAEGGLLQLYLVETEIRRGGTNGLRFHPMVLRRAADPGATATFDTADLDPAKLAIVAVLRDPKTRRVLQATYQVVTK